MRFVKLTCQYIIRLTKSQKFWFYSIYRQQSLEPIGITSLFFISILIFYEK